MYRTLALFFVVVALMLSTSQKGESWTHGVSACPGGSLLLASGCGDVLTNAGAVQLTAN